MGLEFLLRLECDVCGKTAWVDDADPAYMPRGWRIEIDDGQWVTVDEHWTGEDMYIEPPGLFMLAVCPGCDPADLSIYRATP